MHELLISFILLNYTRLQFTKLSAVMYRMNEYASCYTSPFSNAANKNKDF